MNAKLSTALRWYLWILMGGLLQQGLVSLVFRLNPSVAAAMPYLVRGVFGIDLWHAWIHIAWGSVSVVILARSSTRQSLIWLGLAFGVFYTALGIAGVQLHHPLGLELDAFENGFHLTAGPVTLLIALLDACWGAKTEPQKRPRRQMPSSPN
jgi:hypothetical protein